MATKHKAPASGSGPDLRPSITSVSIDRRVLEGFRRRAKKAYPREFLEAMIGQATIHGEVLVHAFCAVPHEGTRDYCNYDPADMCSLEEEFAPQGLHVVGSIHSHPSMNTCVHPSDLDHATGVEHGEFVMGVLHVFKQNGVLRTRCHFSVPRKPLAVIVS